MSKGGLITLLGFILLILPFLGIPTAIKIAFTVVFALVVMALGFLVREEKKWMLRALNGDSQADAYTENSARAGMQGYATHTSEHSA